MAVFRFPPGSNLDDIFNVIKAMSLLPAETDAAIVEAIRVLAEGSLASDKQLLDLITALIDRVQKLENAEAARFELYASVVKKLDEAVRAIDTMQKEVMRAVRKDVH